MKDILVLVATGFEDTELVTSINIFDRETLSFDLLSVENKKQVKAQRFALVETKTVDEININNYKALFIPGGKGHKIILEDNESLEIIKKFSNQNKIISAICAAPEILLKAQVIDDKTKITSFPGYAKNGFNTGKEVEVSNNIITGRDVFATIPFAKTVVKHIKNMA